MNRSKSKQLFEMVEMAKQLYKAASGLQEVEKEIEQMENQLSGAKAMRLGFTLRFCEALESFGLDTNLETPESLREKYLWAASLARQQEPV